MKIENQGRCLSISEIPELTSQNSARFRDEVRASMSAMPELIEINLAHTRFMDSSGLGALFAVYRASSAGNGVTLRLLNPTPEIQQLLELTQMQQLFEIVKR